MTALLIAALLASTPDAGTPETLPELRRIAKKLEPQLTSPWVKQWLANVEQLKPVKPTTWWCSKDKQTCTSKKDPALVERVADDEFVYARITDPIGYGRAYEILASHGFSPSGKRVLDFGYGNVGQLLMLARLGAEVHGLEVDALLPLATKQLVGRVGTGSLTLHHGFFASDRKLVQELGGGFDLWMSKNTLKHGYVHPSEPTDAKAQIDLGLEDAQVLALIFKQLAPGGFLFIYNIAPAQTSPYKPMADGRSPFVKEALIAAGFEVIAFDVDDSPKVREQGRALEWAEPGEDLEKTLFATYLLARKPPTK